MSCRKAVGAVATWKSYGAKFKQRFIEFAEDDSNPATADHLSINKSICDSVAQTESSTHIKASTTRKTFTGPLKGRYRKAVIWFCNLQEEQGIWCRSWMNFTAI